jgi:hypothetical protein
MADGRNDNHDTVRHVLPLLPSVCVLDLCDMRIANEPDKRLETTRSARCSTTKLINYHVRIWITNDERSLQRIS